MKFDWYQTTIKGQNPHSVLRTLAKLGDSIVVNPSTAKMYRYVQGFDVMKDGVVIAKAAMGQARNDGELSTTHVHAWATSDDAPAFASLVQEEFSGCHYPTRIDACEDFVDPDAYRLQTRAARRIARSHRLKFIEIKDRLNPSTGRTQYIGSPKSDYRGRIYEKGWEMLNKLKCSSLRAVSLEELSKSVYFDSLPSSGSIDASHWVRSEIQARPQGDEAKSLAADASPEQIWGFTDWSHELAKEIFNQDMERLYVRTHKQTDDEKALAWMVKQYGPMLCRLHLKLGDWETLGARLGKMLSGE